MGWPPDIRDRIVNEASKVFKKQVYSLNGSLLPAVYLPSPVELKMYFVETQVLPAKVSLKPFADAIKHTHKPPLLNNKYSMSWCGIFATWVYRKAYDPHAHWVLGDYGGPRAIRLKKVKGNVGVSAGDIAVIRNYIGAEKKINYHFFIVVDCSSSQLGDKIWSIEGNTSNQLIKQRKKHRLADIVCYYTYDDGIAGAP